MSRSAVAFSGWGDLPARNVGHAYAPCSTQQDQSPYGGGYEQAVCDMQHDGKITADGWSFDYETWQGARTSDLSIGQWNTPDPFSGVIQDPMSQKPFMWNLNNPYDYSDPSGFAPCADGYGWNGTECVPADQLPAIGGTNDVTPPILDRLGG